MGLEVIRNVLKDFLKALGEGALASTVASGVGKSEQREGSAGSLGIFAPPGPKCPLGYAVKASSTS